MILILRRPPIPGLPGIGVSKGEGRSKQASSFEMQPFGPLLRTRFFVRD